MPDARLERTRRSYEQPLSLAAVVPVIQPGDSGSTRVESSSSHREAEGLTLFYAYTAADDANVQAALDADRLAWGVTANVIDGHDH